MQVDIRRILSGLDSGLQLKEHHKIRFQKAKQAEKRVKTISGKYGLASGLVRRVQIAAVQSVALYGAELWWKGQKDAANELQKLINKQARAITGALPTTSIDLLIKEAGLTPAEPLLDYRERKYALRGLKLPAIAPANQLLPPTLRYGDGDAQPGQYSTDNLQWIDYRIKPRNIAQKLAKKLVNGLDFDPSIGFEQAYSVKQREFSGNIIISEKDKAKKEANIHYKGLILWSDGSKNKSGGVGAGVTWKKGSRWQEKSIFFNNYLEIYDAELMGILQALKIAVKEQNINSYKQITVFSDSKTAIKRCLNDELGPGQEIAIEIISIARNLTEKGARLWLRWVPGHANIEGNERADTLAKKAADQPKNALYTEYTSFTYIGRAIRQEKNLSTQKWLFNRQKKRLKHQNQFQPQNSQLTVNKDLFLVQKQLSSRFLQLKMGHAITANYLHRIKKIDNTNCWWCSNRNQTIKHLLFECQFWRKERNQFYAKLAKKGIARPYTEKELFSNVKAFKAILAFLNATKIGIKPDLEDIDLDELDRWGIELISSSRSEGVG